MRYHARMITLIEPGSQDLGGFLVRRALPHRRCRHVGPFVFFDHMGPARFEAGRGVDVRPHPHIGLATVTYLFAGALEHRDSLGSVQTIRPGDINWMTAGRGIVHSERTPHAERSAGHDVHGIQIWVALPRADEATEPSFHHHPARTLPEIECGDVHLRLLVGSAFDRRSPVATHSAMFYVAADFAAGGTLTLAAEHAERAVYAVDAPLAIDGTPLPAGCLAVLPAHVPREIRATARARAVLFGGAPLDGERFLWWNFVASSRERIECAKADWADGRFPPVPGETEFIPLPER